ncbi:F5/8 type C domain containing protein [Streptococcus pneumoniae]|nr:F5/8 type C domain containing protein [Streptococcus pneumoniae]
MILKLIASKEHHPSIQRLNVNKRAGVMIKNVSKEEFTITLENGIRLSSNHFSDIGNSIPKNKEFA